MGLSQFLKCFTDVDLLHINFCFKNKIRCLHWYAEDGSLLCGFWRPPADFTEHKLAEIGLDQNVAMV